MKQTIWLNKTNSEVIEIIDQRSLPHEIVIESLKSHLDMARAISEMHVRGAPLLGVCGGYGMYLATLTASESSWREEITSAATELIQTRPTAVNLEWGVRQLESAILECTDLSQARKVSLHRAECLKRADIETCKSIGQHGHVVIERIIEAKGSNKINILTHCNAGWLACVEFGTATAPIYEAHKAGINVHVFVDETRPRNQGASLTAWELGQAGVPHTVIVDNAGGHLMQQGMVDLVIVGADRIASNGDAANKIGTYLKALSAYDNGIPFYVAAPSSTIDWTIRSGAGIPIEERDADEVKFISGICQGEIKKVLLTPTNSPALNFGFDVTPSRLITGIITERGIAKPEKEELLRLFPEFRT